MLTQKKWKCEYYDQLHSVGATKITAHLTKMKNSISARCPNVLKRYLFCLIQKGVGTTFAMGLLEGKILRHNFI